MAIPVPWVMAAPLPSMILATTNVVKFGDMPATNAPRTKISDPPIYTFLRPIRSDNRPIGNSKALMVRA